MLVNCYYYCRLIVKSNRQLYLRVSPGLVAGGNGGGARANKPNWTLDIVFERCHQGLRETGLPTNLTVLFGELV